MEGDERHDLGRLRAALDRHAEEGPDGADPRALSMALFSLFERAVEAAEKEREACTFLRRENGRLRKDCDDLDRRLTEANEEIGHAVFLLDGIEVGGESLAADVAAYIARNRTRS